MFRQQPCSQLADQASRVGAHRFQDIRRRGVVREVFRSPKREFDKDRGKVDSLFGEPVDELLSVRRMVGLNQQPGASQTSQTVREDIGRDSLSGAKELSEFSETPEHQIANDQQRPTIADKVQCLADGAAGSSGMLGSIHGSGYPFACVMQASSNDHLHTASQTHPPPSFP